MKNIFLICTFIYTGFCFSQVNGKAYYVKKINPKFEKKIDSLSNKTKNPFNTIKEFTQNLEFILEFNKTTAVYKEEKKMTSDNDNVSSELAKILSGYSGPSYYNFDDKKVTFVKDFFNDLYLIEKETSSYNWVLTKERMTINNLTCYKATTTITNEGKNGVNKIPITAWYSIDINTPAGPDGFCGLPGLIVQLEKANFITVLTKIKFFDSEKKIELPKKGKKIKESEFNKLVKENVVNRRY